MALAEIIAFWCTIFIYLLVFCFHLFSFVSEKKTGQKYAFALLWIGFACHTATGLIRWIDGRHPPVTDTYELNLTGTWFTVLIFQIFTCLRKVPPALALVITPIVFLILGHGFINRQEVIPMGPAYQSPWLIVHVIFAWLAFGFYALATGSAVILLLNQKYPAGKIARKTPEPAVLDLAQYRFVILGFINHAVMLISGAIWARKLWGHYWSWDPLETWSLIAFLFYAFYLHARTFLGWKMKRAAWLTLLGLLILAVSFWGVDWFAPTVHPGP